MILQVGKRYGTLFGVGLSKCFCVSSVLNGFGESNDTYNVYKVYIVYMAYNVYNVYIASVHCSEGIKAARHAVEDSSEYTYIHPRII